MRPVVGALFGMAGRQLWELSNWWYDGQVRSVRTLVPTSAGCLPPCARSAACFNCELHAPDTAAAAADWAAWAQPEADFQALMRNSSYKADGKAL